MRRLIMAILVVVASVTGAASLDFYEARDQGLVGETQSGYAAPVGTPTPEIEAMVDQVNIERRGRYDALSRQQNLPMYVVESLAGQSPIGGLPAGSYYQDVSGQWVQK